jgi:hypothetical protein
MGLALGGVVTLASALAAMSGIRARQRRSDLAAGAGEAADVIAAA